MSKLDSVLACCTGAITAIVSVSFESVLSSLVLGFVGALGGWLFTKGVSFLIESIRKIKKQLKNQKNK